MRSRSQENTSQKVKSRACFRHNPSVSDGVQRHLERHLERHSCTRTRPRKLAEVRSVCNVPPFFPHLMSRTCASPGCGCPAFGNHATCCVKCGRGEGHNLDCAAKVAGHARKRKVDDSDEATARLQQRVRQPHPTLPASGDPDVYCTTRSRFDPREWELGDPRYDKRAKFILNMPLGAAQSASSRAWWPRSATGRCPRP